MNLTKLLPKRKNDRAEKTAKNDITSAVLTVIKVSFIAIGVTVVLFFAAALILYLTGIDENAVPVIVEVIRILSIALSGIICGRAVSKMGWLAGLAAGILYTVITVLVGAFCFDSFKLDLTVLVDTVIGAAAGFVSGVIGINTRKKKIFP